MPYLIDGHNLIAKLPDIDLSDPDDEAKLVNKLKGFVARRRTTCTVIFDGGLPGGASTLSTRSVKVIFAAAHHADADALIKRRIHKTRDARNWTLVTSDRKILAEARSQRMRQMSAADFARELARGARTRSHGEEAEPPPQTDEEIDEWLDIFGIDDDRGDSAQPS